MDTTVIIFVLGVIAIFAFVYAVSQRNKQNEYAEKFSKIESENKRLKEQNEHYKKLDSSENDKPVKEDKELGKKAQSADLAELKENNKALKAEIAKLKEKNYSLDQDNKSLRKDIKENNESSNAEQKEIVSLREANNDLNASLAESKAQLAAITKELSETRQSVVNVAPVQAEDSDNSEKSSGLQRENAQLQASLKDVRSELAVFKKDFKAEVDAAKKEVSESNRALRKELSKAERLMQQSKKRAENSRILYLVARSQMMLAEKRLAALDPNFKPSMLPTSADAIDEAVKKFLTATAREANSIQKLNDKIKDLEAENEALKIPKEDGKQEISADEKCDAKVVEADAPAKSVPSEKEGEN